MRIGRVTPTGLMAILLALAVFSAGCGRERAPAAPATEPAGQVQPSGETDPAPRRASLPREVRTLSAKGEVWSDNKRSAVSPDGKYVLAVQGDSAGTNVVAIPIDGTGDKPVALHSVEKSYLEKSLFGYRPLGWISSVDCVFLAHGWQNTGPHKGKRGVAILVGCTEDGSSEEIAFIPQAEGVVGDAAFIAARGKAYVHMSGAIWECDVLERKARLVRGNLLTYDGLFWARMSPDGQYYVYDLYEDNASGVFLLDTTTGQERPLLPRGHTMSFYPAWSPDGKYVAAYTVDRVKASSSAQGATGVWDDYAFLPAEDGPQPAGNAITIVGLDGAVVQTLMVEGKYLSTFKWGPSSTAIGFVTGTLGGGVDDPQGGSQSGMEVIRPDGVWLARIGAGETPKRLADLRPGDDAERPYVVVQGLDPDGAGVLYSDYRDQETGAWRVRSRGSSGAQPAPSRVDEGSFSYGSSEVILDDVRVEIVEGADRRTAWLVDSAGAVQIAESRGNRYIQVLGYNETLLVLSDAPGFGPDGKQDESILRVFEMTPR